MDLGDRIKSYERAYDIYMPSRLPVIVRVDGKGFSKWTKKVGCKKPFDHDLSRGMSYAMVKTAENIEGCVFGFTQSDEITFILKNDQSLESTPWFGNRVQKMASVIASMVSAHFGSNMVPPPVAYFDARIFIVPSCQEAINCLIWRQQDATKNSISSACYYEVANKTGKKTARKKMHGLNQKQQQELLFQETKINWNNYPTKFKRGTGCYKVEKEMALNGNTFMRSSWYTDEELPVFAQNQDFLKEIIGFDIGDTN